MQLTHSDALNCDTEVYDESGSCTTAEYGDPFDIMGSSEIYSVRSGRAYFRDTHGHYNCGKKEQLGWLTPVIHTPTLDGTFILSPIETESSGTQCIKIPFSGFLGAIMVRYWGTDLDPEPETVTRTCKELYRAL